ncbi:MAG: hypothetical protein Q8K58_12525 [Acidimicrobiales bacterium]|nr:hypothetical protein [Acidimicrobiales bacterium]
MSDQQSDPADTAAAKSPIEQAVEQALDVLVYAPIGLLFEGASLLPQLVQKGKHQVTMARMIGQFATEQGRQEAEKLAGRLQDQATTVLGRLGDTGSSGPGASVAPAAASAARAGRQVVTSGRDAADKVAGAVVEVASLAIPDYDGLSASHVVNRLAGLSVPELESVRLYELANRGRKTILSKIAQLQSS